MTNRSASESRLMDGGKSSTGEVADAALKGASGEARAAAYSVDSMMIGPASHMMLLRADERGDLSYRLGAHRGRRLPLGREFARRPLALIDILRSIVICDSSTNQLVALAAYPGAKLAVFLFGELWGRWVDEEGRRHPVADPVRVMMDKGFPVTFESGGHELRFDTYINAFARDVFAPAARRYFRSGNARHQLGLLFELPSGRFEKAQVVILEPETGSRFGGFYVRDFPVRWPAQTAVHRPIASAAGPSVSAPEPTVPRSEPPREPPKKTAESPHEAPAAEATREKKGEAEPERPPRRPVAGPGAEGPGPRPSAASVVRRRPGLASARPGGRPPRPSPPLPATQHLDVEELVRLIQAEPARDRRWKLIEANLQLRRPERSYALISHFAEQIGEETPRWTPARLRTVLGDLPGGILIGLMHNWTMNQVLAVSENNPENAKILSWLREREVDRMLRLDLTATPTTAEAARSDLFIDRTADAPTIRRVWRTLLGFLNADHGRSDERAIHRKKDEIAKHLQLARDLLLRRL